MLASRTALLCSAVTMAFVVSDSAFAQVRSFQIASQPARTGIPAFAHQAGLQILAPAGVTEGVSVNEVRGEMDSAAALRQLLAGTGLAAFPVGKSLSIRRTGGPVASAAPRTPSEVRTVSFRDGDTAATPAPAQAPASDPQQPAESAASAVPAAPAPGDIVVTAQKRAESVQRVPISIAVLGGVALDKQAVGGSLEALNAVPGIGQTIAPAGGMTQLSMRGVAPAGFFGSGTSTVGYYLDSIPFQFVRNAMVPNAKSYDMSRVEVLRGPQGTLYGASALNGVVRIITNDANLSHVEFKARGGVSITKGGDPSFRADAALNVPLIENKLAIRIVGGVERLGGWIEQPLRPAENANSSQSDMLRIKLAAAPTENLRIDLGAWFSRSRYDASDYADASNNQYTLQAQPGKTNYDAYNGRITYDLPFATLSSSTSYLKFRQQMYTDQGYITPAARPPLQLFTSLPAHVFSEEMLFSSRGSSVWRWSAGLYYRNAEDDRFQTNPPILRGTLYWRERSRSYAAFGQITRTFADDRFEITGGLRYFHDHTETETPVIPGGFLTPGTAKISSHAVSPRVVATWLPSTTFTAYASYSQGFRAGLNQMPLVLSVAAIPPIKSDTLNNYEIGAKGKLFDGLLVYDISGYYIKWLNVQTATTLLYGPPGQQGTVAALINGSSASGFGTDVSLTLRPARGLQVGGTLSINNLHTDGPILDRGNVLYNKGDQLAFSPRRTLSAFLSYDFPLSASLDGAFRVSADYRTRQLQRVPGQAAAVLSVAGCDKVAGTTNSVCYGEAPLFVNANFDIANHNGKTLSIYVQNLNNWTGLLEPSTVPTGSFRPRPRTIGVQFEAKF